MKNNIFFVDLIVYLCNNSSCGVTMQGNLWGHSFSSGGSYEAGNCVHKNYIWTQQIICYLCYSFSLGILFLTS